MCVNGRDVVGEGVFGIFCCGGGEGVVEVDCDIDDGDEELIDEYVKSVLEEDGVVIEMFNGLEGDGGWVYVDDGEDYGDDEWVGNGIGGFEEGGWVVEDEVDISFKCKRYVS